MAKITAVVELGSNSIRMSIFKRSSRYGYHIVDNFKKRCPLLLNKDEYSKEDITYICDIIEEFLCIAKEQGSKKTLIFATEALRKSKNKNELVNFVYKALAVKIKVLDDIKEAYYGALSAINNTKSSDFLVVDIGGGSTEVSVIKDRKFMDSVSMKIGTLKMEDEELLKQEFKKIEDFHSKNLVVLNGSLLREVKKTVVKEDYLHLYSKCMTKAELLKSTKDNETPIVRLLHLLLEKVDNEVIIREGGTREGYYLYDAFRKDRGIIPLEYQAYTATLLEMFDISKKKIKLIAKNANMIFDYMKDIFELDDSLKETFRDIAKLSLIKEHIKDNNTLRLLLLNQQFYRTKQKEMLYIASTIYYETTLEMFRDDIDKELVKKLAFMLNLVSNLYLYKDMKYDISKIEDVICVDCESKRKPILEDKLQSNLFYTTKVKFHKPQ